MFHTVATVVCLFLLSSAIRADGDQWSDAVEAAHQAQRAGDYHRAKSLLTHALADVDESDDSSERQPKTKIQLVEALLALGEYARCEQLCIEVIGALEQQKAARQLQVVHLESVLARLYLALGMARRADPHCNRALEICKSLDGPHGPDIAEVQALMRHIWNLSSEYGNSGGEGSLRILEESYGMTDGRLIAPLEALAGDCYDRWTPPYASRAVSIAEAVYGKQHPIYGRCLSTLATAHRHTRAFDESERLSKQAIDVFSSTLGDAHPELWVAYRNLASVERERGQSAQSEAYLLESIRLRFSTLTDAELCHFFDRFMASGQFGSFDDDVTDMYLTEMTRRGGEIFEQFLTTKTETWRQEYLRASKELENVEPGKEDDFEKRLMIADRVDRYSQNLAFVTALCRIQQKPDPLQILIEGPQALTCEFPELPELDVTIRNVDVGGREIGFQESGDYRSGRQARWRIEVTDAAGTIRASKQLNGIIIGGGIFQLTTLKPQDGWQTTLTAERFVESLNPGEYQVRVLYHNDLTIVDREFVGDLIVCRSESIPFTIRQRSIEFTKEQQEQIKEVLARFDDGQTCKIIDGSYGEWAHEFIDPETEYGRLLTLRWSAVPALIEELEREGQTPERLAHLLALLFSITGENDPRSPGLMRDAAALGSYSMLEQGWSVTSKRAGEAEPSSAGFGFTSGPSTYDATLEAYAQAPLIKQWQRFKAYLQVTRPE